jgi:tRNA/tmRNA/rRNA uracil-C5-methylase (TrmA/RlmC/RlmD family)
VSTSLVGSRFEVTCGKPGHGGFVVARHEGVVVFVRHGLPGERVVAEVTEGAEGDRFLRADAVEILDASPDRVAPPCPFSGPGRCGGCDFQHVDLQAQRLMKAAVVAEQLQRLAGLDVEVTVEEVPGDSVGLGWRTRVQWAVDGSGRPGLRKHRSHDVVTVDHCPIAHPDLPPVLDAEWQDAESVEAIVSTAREQLRLVNTRDGATFADGPLQLHERAAERDWQVTGSGFWQVHPGAADTLVDAVRRALAARPGESVVDLYAGVGLFAGALAGEVAPSGQVVAIESDSVAADDAVANLGDLPNATVTCDRVERALDRLDTADLVVLDPPRTGAKRRVVRSIAALEPRAVAYVACDPAALARDVGYFAEHGYALSSLRAFDLFPMTHHVECVALLTRVQSS